MELGEDFVVASDEMANCDVTISRLRFIAVELFDYVLEGGNR